MDFGNYINENNKYIKILLVVSVILGAGTTIISVINSYPNWRRPKVKVNSVDYEDGNAQVEINGKHIDLIGDSVLTAGGDWGVKFGYASTSDDYETIELTKNDKVYQVLAKRDATPLPEERQYLASNGSIYGG